MVSRMMGSILYCEPAEEDVQSIHILGWVIELIQLPVLTLDNIVDKDLWRRGG